VSSERYSRSLLFPGIGPEGQRRIGSRRLAIVGVGAVGSAAAEIAVRAGFGEVMLVDRDVVEESNLQRQFLFDEEDARLVRPKAEAAAEKLSRMNSEVRVRPVVEDLSFENAEAILFGQDIVVDGCDNFETRLLVSDAGKKMGIPTIYAACVGSDGLVAVTTPDRACPCLRCYLGALPPAGTSPTCDTAGVVPSLPPLVASIAMSESLRLAVGRPPSRGVLTLSVWAENISPVRAFAAATPSALCDVCAGRRYPALEGEGASETVKLCGRASVQVKTLSRERPDFDRLERSLSRFGRVQRSSNVLSAPVEDVTLTLFSDGRCVVRGTGDPERAKSLYRKYVGR
jgi:molybdopterin/thiamine biosynthesis adenylyltransferase